MTRTGCWLAFVVGLSACSRSTPVSSSATVPQPVAGRLQSALVLAPTDREVTRLVDIREFRLPTADALPHDPAVGPDGTLWVTEQRANLLGRLDLATGAFRDYPLPIPASGPHGLAVDPAGNVWFTANSKGYIGKLDPVTSAVTAYPVRDAGAKDPHTPVLARGGTLWFTAQESNLVGRLDTKTGKTELKALPTAHAQPYGIVLGKDGAPYVCEFGANKIARIDQASMAVTEYVLPEGARPRRIALAPDGMLYYSDFARGELGRLVPATGAIEEWASPGGPGSKPYAIAATPDGTIWYSESGVHPNALVRFDPETKRFATVPIPSGGGVVRNMAATPDGRLFLACSGTDRVAVATPRSAAEIAK